MCDTGTVSQWTCLLHGCMIGGICVSFTFYPLEKQCTTVQSTSSFSNIQYMVLITHFLYKCLNFLLMLWLQQKFIIITLKPMSPQLESHIGWFRSFGDSYALWKAAHRGLQGEAVLVEEGNSTTQSVWEIFVSGASFTPSLAVTLPCDITPTTHRTSPAGVPFEHQIFLQSFLFYFAVSYIFSHLLQSENDNMLNI